MHEYTVIGHPREKIIYFIAFISIFLSPILSKLILDSFAHYFNVIFSLSISGTFIFGCLYYLFSHSFWSFKIFNYFYNFPDLNGEWTCKGLSYKIDNNPVTATNWDGKIIIKQTWDKILIILTTNNSSSKSLSVISGIKHYPGLGYKLSYHYENTPNISEPELKKHEGFCVLTFNETLERSDGFYFNNIKERKTYGELSLTRSKLNE